MDHILLSESVGCRETCDVTLINILPLHARNGKYLPLRRDYQRDDILVKGFATILSPLSMRFSIAMNFNDMPSLNAIEAFEAAARHLSFTEAAQERCVSQGAVSRMVRQLEQTLGIQLFERAGRGLALTEAGSAYYAEVHAALHHLRSATRSLRGLVGGNVLKVSALPTFAVRRLVPMLPKFHAAHPEILIDLIAKDESPEDSLREVDASICVGSGDWKNIEAMLLFRETLAVYCRPDFRNNGKKHMLLHEIAKLPLLIHSTRPHAWNEFFAMHRLPAVDLHAYPRFEHFFMLVEAAASGLGVALLPTFYADEEVAAGRLRRAFTETAQPEHGYYLAHKAVEFVPPRLSLFKEWLREAMVGG